jgi:uncharacterized protein DUF5906/TOTE conflict system primase-like protein
MSDNATDRPPTDEMPVAAGLAALFAGLERVYGRYVVPADTKPDEHGKKLGRRATVKETVTPSVWCRHVSGKDGFGIGIVPIRDDDSCVFGAIDIDVYPFDHRPLIANVERLGLPLIVCRTKSGGAHCYAFTSEPVPAKLMRAKLTAWAAALGHPGVEIFPKQDRLTGPDDCGSWINIPYNGRHPTRYAFKPDGTAMKVDEFLAAADVKKSTGAQLAAWKQPPAAIVEDDLWTGAPPCLRTLAVKGFGDWQNNGLFNIAVYLKKRHGKDGLADRLALYDERFMSPPAGPKDVRTIAKSVARKQYFYKCHDQPIVSVCEKEACRDCAFGIGRHDDGAEKRLIAELNESHALVLLGDKPSVLKEGTSSDGRPTIEFLTTGAFRMWYGNRAVMVNEKKRSLGDLWLTHPDRRQYEGLAFLPGRDDPKVYNLWRGFAVEPKQGEWSKFHAHLRDNVCGGDDALLRWVVGWFAAIVQHPERKVGTSLVIRGKEGTGKTKVGEVFGSLFGSHYVAVSDPRYVTGRFNSHLASCLLLHAEEAFWAGDHAAEGKLKDLITGDVHLIEYKGKEPISVRNLVRLFVTGNPEWVVPVSLEGRRFAVIEIGDSQIRNGEYFAAIDDEMNDGGREALLHDLLQFDLSSVNLRIVPMTEALRHQKDNSLNTEEGWWLDVLERGQLPWGVGFANGCAKDLLFDRYIDHANKRGVRRRSIQTLIGIFLKRMVPGLRSRVGPYRGYNAIDMVGGIYEFPSLKACRASFDKLMGQPREWSEVEDWLDEPERRDPPNDASGIPF